jgi:hypothetical protein
MKKYEGRFVGILGTVIIHLIAAIIFMSFQLKSIQKEMAYAFQVELAPIEVPDPAEKKIEVTPSSVEKILSGDEEMLNIARNLANRSEQKINPDDYIDMVKEELIKSGKLGADNYIDEQKRAPQPDEGLSFENKKEEKENKPEESQKMASNYQGPTRIYYDISGRTHTYLPLPIYKCKGSGKVVLSIEVNQKGIVEKADIISNVSTATDQCLIETAINTALISRFNSDINSPKIQKGTLSYHFVAQ